MNSRDLTEQIFEYHYLNETKLFITNVKFVFGNPPTALPTHTDSQAHFSQDSIKQTSQQQCKQLIYLMVPWHLINESEYSLSGIEKQQATKYRFRKKLFACTNVQDAPPFVNLSYY